MNKVFLDCFVSASLTKWVMEGTFVSSGNILDLFLTSETDRVRSVQVLALFPKCLHTPVIVEIFFSRNVGVDENIQQRFLWHRDNYCAISETLNRFD